MKQMKNEIYGPRLHIVKFLHQFRLRYDLFIIYVINIYKEQNTKDMTLIVIYIINEFNLHFNLKYLKPAFEVYPSKLIYTRIFSTARLISHVIHIELQYIIKQYL